LDWKTNRRQCRCFFTKWAVLCEKFAVGNVCYALIGAAIPVMISGCFMVVVKGDMVTILK